MDPTHQVHEDAYDEGPARERPAEETGGHAPPPVGRVGGSGDEALSAPSGEARSGMAADLAGLLAEIERLSDLDPTEAAEPAARIADVLGAVLEAAEEDR